MNDDKAKAFDHLYTALHTYQTKFIDTSLQACMFFLIVMGWFISSEKASAIAEDRFNKVVIVLGLVLGAASYILLSLRGIQLSTRLYRELDALQYYPPSYYERLFKPHLAMAMLAVPVSPCIVLVIFVLSRSGPAQ